MDVELLPMTRGRMHEMYRAFTLDPDIFDDMELYEKNKDLAYDPAKVDALFDMRAAEEGSAAFAVMLGGAVIGEVGLRHFSPETKECELSIHMQNDAVKNKGYGTRAEQLAVDFAFDVLGAERVVADSIIKNARSQHVLEKLGFKYLGEKEGFRLYALERKDRRPREPKTIEMIGDDYEGASERTRTSCRGIVLRGGKLLLSYETSSGLWMIPGGGFEPGEDESDCCIREVIEETGFVIEPSPCALRIEEKYKRWGFTTLYFFGRVTGMHDRNLTEREAKAGMEPRWIPVAEAKKNFSQFEGDGISELRRILYRREYTALCALFPETEE